MKQIIPFKKELLFKTKVSEITSISLEHNLTLKNDDLVSGEFNINGDYKMTEGSINREKFQFKLPFDIALDSRYDMASIIIDIDNFYYEIINNEALKVNIDVYVEGKKIEEDIPKEEVIPVPINEPLIEEKTEEVILPPIKEPTPEERKEILVEERSAAPQLNEEVIREEFEKTIEMPTPKIAVLETTKKSTEMEFNLFENMDSSDTYVTYYVYIVKEEDTIDKILTKYNVTKEDIALYNNIENINPGTKLIIPSNCNE